VLDDEPNVAETLAAMAASLGLRTRIFTGATEFLTAAENQEPGYVIVDLQMPDVDGIETIRRLAETHCTSGIILTSGLGKRVLNAAIISGKEHGLDVLGALPKPFLMRQLKDLLHCTQAKDRQSVTTSEPGEHEPIGAGDIRRAISRGELTMVYQPKISCADRLLRGVEALVRWNHPSGKLVTPDSFIPIVERDGIMPELTLHVMRLTLEWFAEARYRLAEDDQGLTVSVNISAQCLQTIDFADQLDALCADVGVPSREVILELTETAAMEDPTTSLDTMTRLKLKGFRLSIDDFGTGYSSMIQLIRLPFSELKIDQSFVLTCQQSADSRATIAATIGLGKSLGMQTTGEGIEDAATLDFLTRQGCDLAQGFFIGRPMTADKLDAWAASRGLARCPEASKQGTGLRGGQQPRRAG